MNENESRHVHDAEVIHTGQDNRSGQGGFGCHGQGRQGQGCGYARYERYYSGGNGNVTFIRMINPGAPGHQGLPLATVITLSLFFGCLLQWGFLAALGFAFFYAIASVLGVFVNVRAVMEGRLPNPWLWRTGSWIVCMLLVSWLVK